MRRRRSGWRSWFPILCLAASSSSAQLIGDLDGDGDVDEEDVPTLGTVLVGPGGPTAMGDAIAFEVPDDSDFVVTLNDALVVQQHLTGPLALCDDDIPVADGIPHRGHAGALCVLSFDLMAGSAAVIDRELLQICDSSDTPAFTAVWTGVNSNTFWYDPLFDLEVPIRWSQLGYKRGRGVSDDFPPSTIIEAIYVEIYSADADLVESDYQREFFALPGFAREEFRCERTTPSFGGWTFSFDTIPFFGTTSPYWVFELADTAQFVAETVNRWDFMPGTDGNRCRFDDCLWVDSALSDQAIDFSNPGCGPVLVYPQLHGSNISGADRVDVWDRR